MRVRELTVNSKFHVAWRVAQLFALTGIWKVNDIVYWFWYCSHILCGLFNLNVDWVFVLISWWKNLLEMLVEVWVSPKQKAFLEFTNFSSFTVVNLQDPLITGEFKIPQGRRKRGFAFFQSLVRLFQLINSSEAELLRTILKFRKRKKVSSSLAKFLFTEN